MMNNRDWERFGEDIKRNVQDAVESGDFSGLNQTVSDTVNHVVNDLGDAVRGMTGQGRGTQWKNGGYQNREFDYRTGTYREDDPSSYGYKQDGAYQGDTNPRYRADTRYDTDTRQWKAAEKRGGYRSTQTGMPPALYQKPTALQVGGIVMAAVGYSTAVICGGVGLVLFLAMLTTAEAVTRTGLGIAAVVLAVVTAIFGVAAGIGTSWLGNIKRFRTYVRELGGKEYCDIKKLAGRLKKSPKYIAKDLQKMISKGWFREGHLDEKGTCLMVTHKAYQQYTDLQEQMRQKQRSEQEVKEQAEQMRREQAENDSNLPTEAREILRSGEEYIRKIHACNDAIPGEEISAKISRIEMLVDRIFVRVKEEPDTVSDLHKMMQYYLPTTVKLLEAYEQLDSQPVQGENILKSKEEIEKTLDTLNVAFEKLLDNLFQDTAWDVSSDISVLHTILAQEGLTEEDFKKTK